MKHGAAKEPQASRDPFGEGANPGLLGAVRTNPASESAYAAVAEAVDLPAFADYLIVNHFGGNTDWPYKNWYATREQDGGKWRFHSWDAEFALVYDDADSVGTHPTTWRNAGGIYGSMIQTDEFKQLLADHIHKHLNNGGLLSSDENIGRLNDLADQIESPLVAEAARWGDGSAGTPMTHDLWVPGYTEHEPDPEPAEQWVNYWVPALDDIRDYFHDGERPATVMQQYASEGLIPTTAPPSLGIPEHQTAPRCTASSGFQVEMGPASA
ncbi:MAG: hypothetical protein GY953_19380, partial [bacterium]|nr:hypothetical protein [bacterium]